MKTVPSDVVLDALKWRYAVKEFDSSKKIPEETLAALKEALVLTPSSFGLQPWKFYFIANQELKDQMPAISWNQTQPKDCSHMVILAVKNGYTRADVGTFIDRMAEVREVTAESLSGYEQFAGGFIDQAVEQGWVDDWAKKQIYIAIGQLMMSAALFGVDACPMEGISGPDYDKLLSIDKDGYSAVVACPLGYRAESDKYATLAKVRYEASDVIKEL